MSKDIILKYTTQTPTRVILLGFAMGFLNYALNNLDSITTAILAFVMGLFIILLRELVSNGDHFKEFVHHLSEYYTITTKEEKEEVEGYQ